MVRPFGSDEITRRRLRAELLNAALTTKSALTDLPRQGMVTDAAAFEPVSTPKFVEAVRSVQF